MTNGFGTGLILILLASFTGCSSIAERCRDACAWNESCSGALHEDACERRCENDYDDADDACRQAFEELVDCLHETKLQCTLGDASCAAHRAKVEGACKGQLLIP